jgi:hypothetical protein
VEHIGTPLILQEGAQNAAINGNLLNAIAMLAAENGPLISIGIPS